MVEERLEKLNLVQKLAKIRSMSDVAKKTKEGFNYSYIDITEILASVKAGMKKYGVSLVPKIVPESAKAEKIEFTNTKFTKTGTQYEAKTAEMLFSADMLWVWVNDDNPKEYIEVPWFATGSMSDPAQAMGAALTYSERQFLTLYFQIAQMDTDVDAYRSKQKEAEVAEAKAIAEGIISQFDILVRKFMADNPDKSEEVSAFIARYAKKSNYFSIKEPSLAAKLMEDFKNKFGIKGE